MRNLAPVSLHQVRADWERVKSEVAYVRVLMLGQRYIEALRREQSQARLDAPDGGSVNSARTSPDCRAGRPAEVSGRVEVAGLVREGLAQ